MLRVAHVIVCCALLHVAVTAYVMLDVCSCVLLLLTSSATCPDRRRCFYRLRFLLRVVGLLV